MIEVSNVIAVAWAELEGGNFAAELGKVEFEKGDASPAALNHQARLEADEYHAVQIAKVVLMKIIGEYLALDRGGGNTWEVSAKPAGRAFLRLLPKPSLFLCATMEEFPDVSQVGATFDEALARVTVLEPAPVSDYQAFLLIGRVKAEAYKKLK